MLHLIHGNDIDTVRVKAQKRSLDLLSKEASAEVVRFDAETISLERLRELALSQSLFDAESIVECRFVLGQTAVKEEVVKILSDLVVSTNIFIFAEGVLDKKTTAAFEKAGAKIEEITKDMKKAKDFNVFALADALGLKDKKTLWVLYQKAILNDQSPEEIHGLLAWQIRSLLLTQSVKGDTAAATKAGLNPYVFRKASGFLRHFKDNELHKLSSELVELYHESRRGGAPLEIRLEKFILSL